MLPICSWALPPHLRVPPTSNQDRSPSYKHVGTCLAGFLSPQNQVPPQGFCLSEALLARGSELHPFP